MDNIKATAHQYSRVTPSQSGEKQRDEGFISSQTEASKQKREEVKSVAANQQSQLSHAAELIDKQTNVLVEQRKQDLAVQVSEKDKSSEQIERLEELNAQRQLESRAAANKEKIKSSYSAVQVNSSQNQPETHKAEKNEQQQSQKSSNPEPINLVV